MCFILAKARSKNRRARREEKARIRGAIAEKLHASELDISQCLSDLEASVLTVRRNLLSHVKGMRSCSFDVPIFKPSPFPLQQLLFMRKFPLRSLIHCHPFFPFLSFFPMSKGSGAPSTVADESASVSDVVSRL